MEHHLSWFSSLFYSFFNIKYNMQSPSKMYTLKSVFDQRALLKCVFIENLYIRTIFHWSFSFSQSFHPHFEISIIQSMIFYLQMDFGSVLSIDYIFHVQLSLFINHLCLLNPKLPKKFPLFWNFNRPPWKFDLDLLLFYILKIEFEDLGIILICELVLLTTMILRVSITFSNHIPLSL